MYEVPHFRWPRLVMVYFPLTVKDDPFPQAVVNLGHELIGNTHDDDVSHEWVFQQHIGHPTATRHHALPLGLLHVGVMVEHDERERFAQLRHPVFGEVVEIARIDEMKGLGGVGRQSAVERLTPLLIAIAVDTLDVATIHVGDASA